MKPVRPATPPVPSEDWVIEIEGTINGPCYVAGGGGDPERTHDIMHAERYATENEAMENAAAFRRRFPQRQFQVRGALPARLDAISKAQTAFLSFAALLDARGGYRPTINVRDAGEAAADMAFLAEQYDLHQERRGDPRRAYVMQADAQAVPTDLDAVSQPGGDGLRCKG